jgi:hypothetical protein
MKMKAVHLVFIMTATLCVSNATLGQSKFAVGLNGGESMTDFDNGGVMSNWDNDGWTIGGSLAYHAVPNVDIDFNLSYSRYS